MRIRHELTRRYLSSHGFPLYSIENTDYESLDDDIREKIKRSLFKKDICNKTSFNDSILYEQKLGWTGMKGTSIITSVMVGLVDRAIDKEIQNGVKSIGANELKTYTICDAMFVDWKILTSKDITGSDVGRLKYDGLLVLDSIGLETYKPWVSKELLYDTLYHRKKENKSTILIVYPEIEDVRDMYCQKTLELMRCMGTVRNNMTLDAQSWRDNKNPK